MKTILVITIFGLGSLAAAGTVPKETAKSLLGKHECSFSAFTTFNKATIQTANGTYSKGEALPGGICIATYTKANASFCRIQRIDLNQGQGFLQKDELTPGYFIAGVCSSDAVHLLFVHNATELRMHGGATQWEVVSDQFALKGKFLSEMSGQKTIKKFVYSRAPEGKVCVTSVIGDVERFIKDGTEVLVSRNADKIIVHDGRAGVEDPENEIWYHDEAMCRSEAAIQLAKEEVEKVPEVVVTQIDIGPSAMPSTKVETHPTAEKAGKITAAILEMPFIGLLTTTLDVIGTLQEK